MLVGTGLADIAVSKAVILISCRPDTHLMTGQLLLIPRALYVRS